MDYYIEEIKGFRAVGFKRRYDYTKGENFAKIPKFWQDIMENGGFKEVMSLMDSKPEGSLGICANFSHSEFDYFIAVSTSKEVPENMSEIFIETQNYAIFTCMIPEIQDVTRRIMGEWLPSSEYEQAMGAPNFELYPEGDSCKICIPIVKKK